MLMIVFGGGSGSLFLTLTNDELVCCDGDGCGGVVVVIFVS